MTLISPCTLPATDDTLTQSVHTVLKTAGAQGRIDWSVPADDGLRVMSVRLPLLQLLPLPWWGPLDTLLRDPHVHDIYVNGPGREVLVGRAGRSEGTGLVLHATWITWLQQRCAYWQVGADDLLRGRDPLDTWDGVSILGGVTAAQPGLRRLRFTLTHGRRTPDGPTLTLRLLPTVWSTLDQLIAEGLLDKPVAALLERAMQTNHVTLVISGETGSGKTTLAAALKETVADRRCVVIQDAPELPTGGTRNDVSYVVSDGDSAGFVACVRAALRQQPDRIIVGEGRGGELIAMVEGAATGHPGLTTIHATSCTDALHRLESYAGKAPDARPASIRADLRTLDVLLVHLARSQGRRQVVEIAELRRGSDRVPGGRFEVGVAYRLQHGVLRPTDDPLRGEWALWRGGVQ